MPKYKARSSSEIERILATKFEFMQDKDKGERHSHYYLQVPDRDGSTFIITTFFSHGGHAGKAVGPELEKKIARQLQVTTSYFRGMLDCTNSRSAYLVQVRDNPVLDDISRLRRRKK
jgi:hypothetical protein